MRSAVLGYSLVETLFVLALTLVLGVVATSPLSAALDDYRAAGAARYLASLLQRARMEAVARSANVAIQVVQDQSRFTFALYEDGNGDGVRTADIRRAIDRALTAAESLSDTFPGVDFGVLPNLPAVDSGGSPPGTDPIKLGSSNLLSFSSLGSSSSGSLYLRGRGATQYVVRVFGETGRTRVLRYDVRTRQWRPL